MNENNLVLPFRKTRARGYDIPTQSEILSIPDMSSLSLPGEVFTWVNPKMVNGYLMINRYLVSNMGRIYDLVRLEFKKGYIDKDGYHFASLAIFIDPFRIDTCYISFQRIVAGTFMYFEGCEDYKNYEVNHKSGNKDDNSIDNLEWTTHQENMKHAYENGLIQNRSLSDEQVHYICQCLQNGEGPKYLADRLGINYPIIRLIKGRRSYTEISSQYIFPNYERHSDKLSDEIIHEVCRRLQNGERQCDIYKDMNISEQVVARVAQRRTYNDISKDYVW